MTIRLKITNEDQDPTRGVLIYRKGLVFNNDTLLATLMPGQSMDGHIWTECDWYIKEFYLKSKPE